MDENNNDMDHADALKALADGVDFDDAPIISGQDDDFVTENDTDDFLQAAADGHPAEVEKIETVGSETQEQLANVEIQVQREKRSAQGKAVARVQAASRALHFRKIALPFLLAMAVVLVLVACMTVYTASNADPEVAQRNPLMANSVPFAVICIAMAVVMAAGGGFFIFEIKKLKAFIAENSK